MITRGDKILIIFVIFLCLSSIFFMKGFFSGNNEKIVIIKVDGKEYERVKIKWDMKPKEIAVETNFGYNLIEVDSQGARVLDASCKDKLDVKQRKIKNPGEIIVCLPNKLTIEVVGERDDIEIDKISR